MDDGYGESKNRKKDEAFVEQTASRHGPSRNIVRFIRDEKKQ